MSNEINLNTVNDDYFLTAKEVADLLRVSPLTLTRWRNRTPNKLPCFKLGRRYLYKVSDVKNYIISVQN